MSKDISEVIMSKDINKIKMIEEIHNNIIKSGEKKYINYYYQDELLIKLMYHKININILLNYLNDSNLNNKSKAIIYWYISQYYIDKNVNNWKLYLNKSLEFDSFVFALYDKAYYLWIDNDYKQSFYYYKLCTDSRFSIAYYDVVDCYYRGKGIDRNVDLAVEYFIKHIYAINKDEVIDNRENHGIPLDLYSKITDKLTQFSYENYRQYINISNKLSRVILIKELIEIVLS